MGVHIISESRPNHLDQAALGFKEWIRGRCVYDCAICNKRFFDRSVRQLEFGNTNMIISSSYLVQFFLAKKSGEPYITRVKSG